MLLPLALWLLLLLLVVESEYFLLHFDLDAVNGSGTAIFKCLRLTYMAARRI
jgi:hypothetical protein